MTDTSVDWEWGVPRNIIEPDVEMYGYTECQRRTSENEDFISCFADKMVIDGITSNLISESGMQALHVSPMMCLKWLGNYDTFPKEDKDGYVESHECEWDNPYQPLAVRHGDIDEEVWIYCAMVCTPDDPDYEHFRSIVEKRKAIIG